MEGQAPPLANVVTLGARDLNKLRLFYERLGWPVVGDQPDYVAFELVTMRERRSNDGSI